MINRERHTERERDIQRQTERGQRQTGRERERDDDEEEKRSVKRNSSTMINTRQVVSIGLHYLFRVLMSSQVEREIDMSAWS